ncbi:MAG TPA: GGDEF domain-containing protein [Methyloceanibacter sp.]|nr:GGDEF domain-containing protein [Methyloceanibacter sp.]
MPRTQLDLLIILALSAPVYTLLLWADAFDLFFEYSRSHENYEIDELVSLLFFVGIAAIVFSLRRIFDLRAEMDQRRLAEVEAQRLARHDALTGLPNRRRFLEEFDDRARDSSENERCAMFVLDLDHFKPVNDLYGHRLGDEVLRVVAQRLSEIVKDNGVVARLGGDEFGIVLIAASTTTKSRSVSPAASSMRFRSRSNSRRFHLRWAAVLAWRCTPSREAASGRSVASTAPSRPSSGRPTWPCTGPRRKGVGHIASSTTRWTSGSSNEFGLNERSSAP